jgi:dTDP-4-dehydrorhamnose reductase
MKAVVIGTGYVAQAYLRALHFVGYHPLVLSRSWFDYYDADKLKFCLKVYQPDVVINCAGYTGETVDDCQRHVGECGRANMELPGMIADACASIDCKLIHISSGCIFNGAGPFIENFEEEGDLGWPNFCGNVYQATKLFGEQRVSTGCDKHWIFRLRMPFNHLSHPRNLLMKLRKYPRILDGLNSLTFLDEFCSRSLDVVMAKNAPPGIYHAAYSDPIRTMEVAEMLRDAGMRDSPCVAYDPKEFLKHHVPRSEAVLDSYKFEKAYGTPFGDVRCALRWCINQLGNEKLKHGE